MSSVLAQRLPLFAADGHSEHDQRSGALVQPERGQPEHSVEDAPAQESSSVAPRSGIRLRFEQVYDEYFDFVWRSVRRLGVSSATAEDVVQEVFVTVHRRLHTFEGRSSLKTWLFGVALGIVRNHRRAAKRRRVGLSASRVTLSLEVDGRAQAEQPSVRVEKAEAVRILYSILEQLEDDKREVFVLVELEQLSASQVAEVLAINVNTVFSRLRAARSHFKHAAARYRARDGWRVR